MRSIVFLAATAAAGFGWWGQKKGLEQPLNLKRQREASDSDGEGARQQKVLHLALDSLRESGKRRFYRRARKPQRQQSTTFVTPTFHKAIRSNELKQADKDVGMFCGLAMASGSVAVQQFIRDVIPCCSADGIFAQQAVGAAAGLASGLGFELVRRLGCPPAEVREARLHKRSALLAFVALLASDVAMSLVGHWLYDVHSPCFTNFVLRIVAAGAFWRMAGVNTGGMNEWPSVYYKALSETQQGGNNSEMEDTIRMVVNDGTFSIEVDDIIEAAGELHRAGNMSEYDRDKIVTAARSVASSSAIRSQ